MVAAWLSMEKVVDSLRGGWGQANRGRHQIGSHPTTVSQLINAVLRPGAGVRTLPCRLWGAISIPEQAKDPLSSDGVC